MITFYDVFGIPIISYIGISEFSTYFLHDLINYVSVFFIFGFILYLLDLWNIARDQWNKSLVNEKYVDFLNDLKEKYQIDDDVSRFRLYERFLKDKDKVLALVNRALTIQLILTERLRNVHKSRIENLESQQTLLERRSNLTKKYEDEDNKNRDRVLEEVVVNEAELRKIKSEGEAQKKEIEAISTDLKFINDITALEPPHRRFNVPLSSLTVLILISIMIWILLRGNDSMYIHEPLLIQIIIVLVLLWLRVFFLSKNFYWNPLVIIAIYLVPHVFINAKHEAHQIIENGSQYEIELSKKNETLRTDEKLKYLGQTNEYLFLYDTGSNTSTIYPLVGFSRLNIKKLLQKKYVPLLKTSPSIVPVDTIHTDTIPEVD